MSAWQLIGIIVVSIMFGVVIGISVMAALQIGAEFDDPI